MQFFKKTIKFLYVFVVVFFIKVNCFAQEFIPPMKEAMYLSGSFAELRGNHFHSGIDIKTGYVTGKKVYAVADGYISRISVTPSGFGKVIYIAHTNGYTSVYAHLNHFRNDIDKYVKEYQYQNERFTVNIFLNSKTFPVKQGDLIAISGNSGSSEGPHLHFEIRNTSDQKPINPLQFDFPVMDVISPKITHLNIYPYDKSKSFINGENYVYECEVENSEEGHHIAHNDTVKLQGPIYFGIGTYDAMDGVTNKHGIYSIECKVDDNTIYSFVADEFLFSETRYINSIIDYATFVNDRYRVYKTYSEPNNKLKMLKFTKNQGIIELDDNDFHTVKFIVKDLNLNTSILTFTVVKDNNHYDSIIKEDFDYQFYCKKENKLIFDDFKIEIAANRLFNDIEFNFYKEKINEKNIYSDVFHIGDRTITSFLPFKISIKIDPETKDDIANRLYIAYLNPDNEWEYSGNRNSNGWISTNTHNFGSYALFCDVNRPEIICTELNKTSSTDISNFTSIKVTIIDKESGIKSYKPTLNGEWILMDYDAKNDLLEYTFDHKLKKGKNIFRLVVKDKCGNISEIRRELVY